MSFICTRMKNDFHISRLQNSPYFCVFKYARAVKQKVLCSLPYQRLSTYSRFETEARGELGNGLFESSTSPPGKPRALTITSFASKDWGPFLTISSWGREFESEVSSLILWYDPRLTTWLDRCDLPHGEIGKSTYNTNFWVVLAENFRAHRNIWKGSPVFPNGMFQTEMRVPMMKSHLWYQFQAFAAVFQ